ncbi:non-ribosomal peptide synthase/polyketide synthase [Nocardia testacea]
MTRTARTRPTRARRPRFTSLPQLMATAVETNPTGIAVRYADATDTLGRLTYAELDERSSRLARLLIARGIGPEDLVAIGIPRSIDSVVAVWAVAKTGAGFVPVDVNYPIDRITHMVRDSGVVFGLSVAESMAGLPQEVQWLAVDSADTAAALEQYPAEPVSFDERLRPLRAEHPAYVIYTSGSTGKPKGVVVTQAGLAGFCAEECERFEVDATAQVLHFASPSFDISVNELLIAIGAAAALVVVAPTVYGGDELAALLRRERVTHVIMTPSALSSVEPAGLSDVRVVIVGGEACPPELVRRWAGTLVEGRPRLFFNGYGPTETTILVNISTPLKPGEPVDIGAPMRNVTEYVLDEQLRPLPTGVTGELYVAGIQLARGYHNRPGLTADRFVANPFDDSGSRLYRTGDLVRWRADGSVDYLGRNDFQVKIRGFRIELGEIDAVLAAHDSVDFAVTVGYEPPSGATVLAAYVHAAAGAAVDTDELLALAESRLPAYMVPASITVLDTIPLTPVGKLDRRALPEPHLGTSVYREPETWLEKQVAAVFADLLNPVDPVGADDNFFDLGGNSLIATQVVARLGAAVDARIPARIIFEASTVARLAERLAELGGTGEEHRALTARPRPERVPLSLAQQRMWFLNRFDENSAAYSIPVAVRLSGALDVAALRAAIGDLVARHEVLRTYYPETEQGPVQVVLPVDGPMVELETRVVAPEAIETALVELLSMPFDVTEEVPLRVALFEIDGTPDEYVLALVVHHIAADGASTGPLTRDLMAAYVARAAGTEPGWQPLPVQYADFALWQREVLGDESDPESVVHKQIEYWRAALADLPDQLELPADRPRPAIQSYAGGRIEVLVDARTHAALLEVARAANATPFMVVHSAFAVLLSRLSGTTDIAVGTPLAGRGEEALDDLIGMFVNTVVFRTQLDPGETFADLLARQREIDVAALAHADVPFEQLVEVLNPVRSTARHPLFQVGLSFQNLAQTALELPGLAVSGVELDTELSQFDLHLIIGDRYDESGAPVGMGGVLTYASALFDRSTAQGFVDRFLRLLGEIVAAPQTVVGELEILAPAERAALAERNSTARELEPAETLASLLDATVAATPDAVALVAADGAQITYAELGARVNRLARCLIAQGVGPQDRVVLGLRRSVDLVVAMYAVATAGGVYVPVDPDQAAERSDYIVGTAAPVCVLTNTDSGFGTGTAGVRVDVPVVVLDELDLTDFDASPVTDAERIAPLRASNTAYVIFTSGSTGRPKGVAVPHAAIVNQLRYITAEFGLNATDAILLKTAATFDLSVWEFWTAAVSGGRMVIAEADGHRDPSYLNELMARERVTTLTVVPSMLDALLDTGTGLAESLRRVLAIGEALPVTTAQKVLTRSPGVGLFNLYGPTEAAVSVTTHAVTDADVVSVPIGVPQWNSRVYVLDSRLRPVPDGVAGELYLAGAQLAQGYFGRPDLSADRFVADPFVPNARMYRTGDLVAWNGAGELEYRGRTDFQVKIRGFRIELGEIEAALLALPGVSQTAVVAQSDPRTGDRLVGYVVPSGGAAGVDTGRIQAELGRRLPSYMVPSVWVELDALPLNANGKLDRKALPEPVFEAREFRAPSTPIEEIVANTFADVLGVERVGADDDFFELGGNSLIATQVAARIGAALGIVLPVRALFEAPTVAALAVRAEQAGESARPPLVAGPRPELVPLSYAQQRMWFLNQYDTSSVAYNLPMAIRLAGDLDVAALQSAMADVVRRHESLRTRYPEHGGVPAQVVVPAEQVELDLAPVPVAAADIAAAVTDFVADGFDVAAAVPLRIRLFETAPDDHVLVVVAHHIAADGFSMAPLARDVMTAYAVRVQGGVPDWAPLPVQYADYTLWQRQVLGAEDDPESPLARQIAFWQNTLADLPDELALPTDRPRPAVASMRGATVSGELPAELTRALNELARARGASMFMVLHAGLAALLARLSGSEDIAIGTPIAGRGEQALDDLVGMFVNTLVLRTAVHSGETFGELLEQAKQADLDAFGQADVPFERLVDLLAPERSQARNPLFQVALSLANTQQPVLDLAGLEVSGLELAGDVARFDLQFTLVENLSGGMDLALNYATELFDEATARTFLTRFRRLLSGVAANADTALGSIEILDEAERIENLSRTGGPAVPASTLPELLAAAVAVDPSAPAVVFEGVRYSYGEFDQRSNQLAQVLIERCLGAEDLVAVAVPRSADSVLAEWAVTKSGAAFLPIDPTYPADRIAHMLTDSGAPVGITVPSVRADLPDSVDWLVLDELDLDRHSDSAVTDADRVRPLTPANTAYVIYTSGSTGLPKGVVVSHAGLANFSAEQVERYRLTSDSRALAFASPSFDASILELLLAVGSAGALVVVPTGTYGGAELGELISREGVTVGLITPSVLASLDPMDLAGMEVIIAGGEAISADLVAKWSTMPEGGVPRRFHNAYGPTEATIATNISGVLHAGDRVTIGGPVRGMRTLILDDRLNPVPEGVAGELYVGGIQLARGYHARAGLTAERFVADPYGEPGSRLYRTGDVVRWRRDAAGGPVVEYVGRNDFQVKVRGFRIELGEIDAALTAHETVDFAITTGHKNAAGVVSLVSYVVAAPGATVDIAGLREFVGQRLASYMVPASVMVLDEVPLTPAGKLDRKALPEPVFETREFRAPSTPVEEIVAGVFADVLQAERVGADDDFFALGGNSLLATQVVARLGAALNTQVPVRVLFEASTVTKLAVRVEQQAGSGGRAALVPQPRPTRVTDTGAVEDAIPLSMAQQRMWFLNRFDQQSIAYNIPLAIRLSGALDVDALRLAVTDLVARHEVLRTVYPETGSGPVQVVLPLGAAAPRLDVRSVPAAEVAAAVAEFASTGFDVTTEVPLRVALLRVDQPVDTTGADDRTGADSTTPAGPGGEFVLAMVMHHIAGDGSSVGPLTRDLMTAYAARTAGAAPGWERLPVQYADYSIWQRELLGDESDPESLAAKQVDYWRSTLAGIPDQLDLPTDRPRPAVQSFAGGRVEVRLDPATHAGLLRIAQQQNATLFMVVHSALAVLLARLSGSDDITIGTPVAGRGEQALDDLIGMFVNTLVFRTQLDRGESFADLLARQREIDIAAYAHADVPFERLVEVLNPARSQGRHPLFQVGFTFQNLAASSLELPGLTVSGVEIDTEISQFDLNLILGDSYDETGAPEGMAGYLTYATALFDHATVAGFAQRFDRLLRGIAADPAAPVGDLEILSESERTRVLEQWNSTGYPFTPRLLLEGFERAAAAYPDRVAVSFEGTDLTYAEFAGRVNRLARLLIAQGVGPESLVGLLMSRSLDLVVGMYAVVAAGGAYVPLDPAHPAERIGYILETAVPVRLLSTTADADAAGVAEADVLAGVPVLTLDTLDTGDFAAAPVTDADRLGPLRANNTAYVIFTSGSTGRPKGVAVPHSAIANQIAWMLSQYPMGAADVYLQKTATTFDVSLWGYFLPLAAGARLVVAAPDGHRDPAYLATAIAEHRVTVTDFVPSMLTVFAAHTAAGSIPALAHVFVIGEALPPETVSAMHAVSDAAVHNLYGPTEAAVSITYWKASGAETGTVPIGVPQWNSRVYVLDSRLRPVPEGVTGELYLAGDQLARGYVTRPDLSADRFVASPFDTGQRMYRTGDLVRWQRVDGQPVLEYLGRTDFQVKFRGQRIELGEIESAFLARPEVSQAVVTVAASQLGEQLVAYVVPAPGEQPDSSELLAAVREVLPTYMVPAAVVGLDELPLNTSGKLDRKALPAPVFETREFRAPSTPIEEIVAGVFADVLGVGRVGADDDFFALGGNSLIATQVAARLSAALDTTVAVRSLFETSTVAALAARIQEQAGSGGRAALVAQPRPIRTLLSGETVQAAPLSPAQQRMWFLNRFDGASAAYNLPLAIRLSGDLDVDALRRAVADVVARHEVLRTVYPETESGPVQVVLSAGQAVPQLEVRSLAAGEVAAAVAELASAGFDVTAEVPLRVALFRVDDAAGEFVMVMVVHHIAGDGSSAGPLTRDLMIAYAARAAGEAPGWPALPVQYADYSIWQRDLLGDETDAESLAAQQLAFWQSTLAGVPDQLDLPMDRPRPAVQSFAGRRVELRIDAATHAGLQRLAQQQGATLFMVAHTAFAVLLARLSGSDDITVGTPVAGRGEQALDDLIGMFVNTLVFRTQLDRGESFTDLLARQREIDIAAFAHADVPFERLVEVLNPARSQARHPLFQVGFTFQNLAASSLELPGLTVSGVEIDTENSQFDLNLILADAYDDSGAPQGVAGYLTYATALFDQDTAQSFADRFTRLLGAIVADPATPVGDFEILAPAERTRVLAEWNATEHAVPGQLLLDGFERAVAAYPDRVALSFEGTDLTYAEFAGRVNRLARLLIAQGVGPESLVGVLISRSIDLVVGMYAVVAAGGAYVPLDPAHPAERIGYILETAAPVCVLTTAADARAVGITAEDGAGADVLAGVPVLTLDSLDTDRFDSSPVTDADRSAPVRLSNTAYVIFTSGSTGRPKGVAVSHSAIGNQIAWWLAQYRLDADDVYLQKTATTFDVSLWGYFLPLAVGARLVVATPDGHRDAEYLAAVIAEQRVTMTDFVPSMLAMFAAHTPAGSIPSLQHVFALGEALPPETVAAVQAISDAAVHNVYGPTEAAVSVTYWQATGTESTVVPIGVPEWNTRVYVLDSRLRPVAPGATGELYLAGDQLARGYVTRPDLSADRFVANPFDAGQRMYRTGDLVRWRRAETLVEGRPEILPALEYLGRTDFQVKFRGQRIELGEIESALLAQPVVSQAVVTVAASDLGEQLVAYVVPAPGEQIVSAALLDALRGVLPVYMVPGAVVALDAFPLNTSGKLDRKALPAPVFETREFRAPSTPIEEIVAGVFADVLGVERVGADDDFFALGGNSLIATQVAARLSAALDTKVAVRTLFEASTVAALAAAAESAAGRGDLPALAPQERPERVPLSLAQQRMWFLNQFDTGSSAYNIPLAVRLSGELDIPALRQAVADVVGRHETLRTVYPAQDGKPYQQVLPVAWAVPDPTPIPVPAAELRDRITEVLATGFDVTVEVPTRAAVFQPADGEYVLVFVVHHISTDGWSMGPLIRDLMIAYAARTSGAAPAWTPLPVQYADYSLWQREVLGSEDDPESLVSAQADYWRRALAGLPDELNLPGDRPRPTVPSMAGGTVPFQIAPELHRAVSRLAAEHNATVFMVVHAVLALLLARLSATDDVAVGTPIAGRGEAELDDVVGMFVNTLVLRSHVRGEASFAEFLAATREADLQAFAHADIPFERLVELVGAERSTARHPLFQVALSFENLPQADFELPGLRVGAVDFDVDTEKFDLSLRITETEAGMAAAFSYARDLFDEDTVGVFARRFLHLLAAIARNPEAPIGDLPITDDAEYRLLTHVRGDDVMATGLLPELLTNGVRVNPDGVAVRYRGRSVTYRELDARSSRLARVLIERGVGPERIVALALPRSYEVVLAFWAVAKAGGAHVPVDPNYPPDRVRHMLTDSGAMLGLTSGEYVDRLPGDVQWLRLDDPEFLAEVAAKPDHAVADTERITPLAMAHPAYVIYTSGSTGLPKGVMVTHGGMGGLADVAADLYQLESRHRFLHICSPSFDPSVLEWVCTAYVGATLVVVPGEIIGGPELAELLRTEAVTHTIITPAVLGTMDPAGLDALEVLSVGGDVTTPELLAKWEPGRKYFNGYGPTETTIISSYAQLFTGGHVTIGKPVHGMAALVLDARLRPVPPGVAGELYLAGGALARGYHNRPGLTADRFVANPYSFEGSRMYRTGDVVRWYAEPGARAGNEALPTVNWEMDYVGRSDFQVKIRGLRVELGEIDTALAAHPDVEYSVTLGRDTDAGATILVSYVLAVPGRTVDTAAVTEFVAERLPAHMVPTVVIVLDEIPLTPVGKLDRKALPEPVLRAQSFRAPVGAVESIICEVFADVLGVAQVGVDDSFFALGGDSILSIQLVSRAKARGVVFTPRDVFERRTVAALAEVAGRGDAGEQQLAELPGGGVGDMPMLPVMSQILDGNDAYQRFSQPMLLRLPVDIDRETLVATLAAVFDHHDALRARLRDVDGVRSFEALPPGAIDIDALIRRVDIDNAIGDEELTDLANAEFDAALGRLDPAAAVMVQFVWFAFDGDRRDVLLFAAHHFVVDGVSWRIIVPDLVLAYSQLASGTPVALPPVGTSLRRWAHGLAEAAGKPGRVAELPYWQKIASTPDPLLGTRAFDPAVDTNATVERFEVSLPADVTEAVLTTVGARYHGGPNDALLAALALALVRWRDDGPNGAALVKLEGHGREEAVVPGADLSRTVGWFTAVHPLRLDLPGIDIDDAFAGGPAFGVLVKSVKEQLLAVPDKGLGYGLLRYLNPDTGDHLPDRVPGQISFNYLGRVSAGEISPELAELGWMPTAELGAVGADADRDMPANAVLDINAIVNSGAEGPVLSAVFGYPAGVITGERAREFADLWIAALTALAEHVRRPEAGGFTPSDMSLVRVSQGDIERWERTYPALSEVWPLSPLQSGLLFHAQFIADGVDVYTMQSSVDLAGTVDPARLRAAAEVMIGRYPNLRTAFVADSAGQWVQVVLDSVPVPWRDIDLRDLPEDERAGELRRLLAADQAEHFDMAVPPLIRFNLVRLAEDAWQLAITSHHILLDGWSMPLLMRELLVLYALRGDTSALPRVASYRNFLSWLAERDRAASAEAWRAELAGFSEPSLLVPHPTPAENYDVGTVVAELDADRTRQLSARAAELGITVNTLLQAAWGVLLGWMTGRDDVVFGTTVSGRPAELPGIESMVGLFINTLPVRVRLDHRATTGELLTDLQRAQAALLEHHYLGLTDIQRAAGTAVQFDSLFVFESYPTDPAEVAATGDIDGMSIAGVGSRDNSHYPLTLVVTAENTVGIALKYLTSSFTADTIETLATRLLRVIGQLVDSPELPVGEVQFLSAAERAELGSRSGGPAVPARTLPDLLAAAVAEDRSAPAVVFRDQRLSYGEMDERSNRLARVLIERGLGAEDLVAVAVPRSADSVLAEWAVSRSGAAFVPVDPTYPADRIAHMLTDSRTRVGVTVSSVRAELPDTVDWLVLDELDTRRYSGDAVTDADRVRPLTPANTAYVIYTSGSTGLPKGVVVTHAGLANFSAEQIERYGLNRHSRALAFASPSFDASILELLLAVGSAGALVVVPPGTYGGAELGELIARERVTVGLITPSVLASLDPADLAGMRVIIAGGEAISADLVAKWSTVRDGGVERRLHNAYGPTEATVATNISGALLPGDPVTIGGPVRGMRALVLDDRLNPVPEGVAGELYVGGIQLARGYHARAGLTAQRFVADPFGEPGSRLYRTGDIVRWRRDGAGDPAVEYVGRNDFQVKIRGFRIELGEIDSALTSSAGVDFAVTVGHRNPAGVVSLVSYVVAAPGSSVDPAGVRANIEARLPGHMVPASIMVIDEIPLTPAGKLDRNALPEPVFAADAGYRAPRTPLEQTVADVFAEVLGVDRVGADDSFFALGGNSLLATKVAARLSAVTGAEISVQWLFTEATVTGLAARIVEPGAAGELSEAALRVVLPIRETGTATPIFAVHARDGLAWSFAALTGLLPDDQPIYGLQSPAYTEPDYAPDSLAEIAARYLAEIRRIQPEGPYRLLGWSLGGVLAHAIATELQAAGEQVEMLALLDSHPAVDPGIFETLLRAALVEQGIVTEDSGTDRGVGDLDDAELARLHELIPPELLTLPVERLRGVYRTAARSAELISEHRPRTYRGVIDFFRAEVPTPGAQQAGPRAEDWLPYVAGEIVEYAVPATHEEMTTVDSFTVIAPRLLARLRGPAGAAD